MMTLAFVLFVSAVWLAGSRAYWRREAIHQRAMKDSARRMVDMLSDELPVRCAGRK
jgi:hypothetical protein